LSKKNIWIVDSSKLVNKLGKFPLPVEIASFSYKQTLKKLKDAGFNPSLRIKNGEIFQSDGSNYISDLMLSKIENPAELYKEIKLINGVIENGLFINTPDLVLVGYKDEVKVLENNSRTL